MFLYDKEKEKVSLTRQNGINQKVLPSQCLYYLILHYLSCHYLIHYLHYQHCRYLHCHYPLLVRRGFLQLVPVLVSVCHQNMGFLYNPDIWLVLLVYIHFHQYNRLFHLGIIHVLIVIGYWVVILVYTINYSSCLTTSWSCSLFLVP